MPRFITSVAKAAAFIMDIELRVKPFAVPEDRVHAQMDTPRLGLDLIHILGL